MKTEKLTLEKVYDSSLNSIWQALTDREQIKKWYFDFPTEFRMVVGMQFDWLAGPPGGKQWLHRGKMLEIIEGRKLVHSWEFPGYSGSSVVSWELFPMGENKTKLIFNHFFLEPFDPKEEALSKANFETGWNHIIHTSLTAYLAEMNS